FVLRNDLRGTAKINIQPGRGSAFLWQEQRDCIGGKACAQVRAMDDEPGFSFRLVDIRLKGERNGAQGVASLKLGGGFCWLCGKGERAGNYNDEDGKYTP